MCCPKKPKKSLDYVINWIDGVNSTLKEINATLENIQTWRSYVESWMDNMQSWKDTVGQDIPRQAKEAVDDVVNNYDWSVLPEEALNAKVDKVNGAIEGNIAIFGNGGSVADSGYKPSDFSEVGHSHYAILKSSSTLPDEKNIIQLDEVNGVGRIYVRLFDNIRREGIFSDYITHDMLNNTFYPDAVVTQNSTKLITSGAVKDAIDSIWSISAANDSASVKIYGPEPGHVDISANHYINLTAGQNDARKTLTLTGEKLENLSTYATVAPDIEPVESSNKLITSGGVYSALNSIRGIYSDGHGTFAKVEIQQQMAGVLDIFAGTYIKLTAGDTEQTRKSLLLGTTQLEKLENAITPDTSPVSGSDKLITSGAVYTLEQAVDHLFTRVRNLEYKLAGIVIASIGLEGAYLGYNTLKYNNNDIIYDHTRNLLWNVDPIFNAVKVGSRILLKYRWASESGEIRVFKTTVSKLRYGPNVIVLNDDIPDYSFAESNYKEITLSVVP